MILTLFLPHSHFYYHVINPANTIVCRQIEQVSNAHRCCARDNQAAWRREPGWKQLPDSRESKPVSILCSSAACHNMHEDSRTNRLCVQATVGTLNGMRTKGKKGEELHVCTILSSLHEMCIFWVFGQVMPFIQNQITAVYLLFLL